MAINSIEITKAENGFIVKGFDGSYLRNRILLMESLDEVHKFLEDCWNEQSVSIMEILKEKKDSHMASLGLR